MAPSALEPRPIERCNGRYRLQHIGLSIESEAGGIPPGLLTLLKDLSFEAMPEDGDSGESLHLRVRLTDAPAGKPPTGQRAFELDGLQGTVSGRDFWLDDGRSSLRLQPDEGRAEASIDASFFTRPIDWQRNFWSFGLMKLLRGCGVFALHAACVVSPAGRGLLLVAEPGSGKSTLAIGLVSRGWRYLSDDAVLLVRESHRIVALALRKHFYVDASSRHRYQHVDPSAVDSADGEPRHRLDIERSWPGQALLRCVPHTIVFPRIHASDRSRLEALAPALSLSLLLKESGPQLFDDAFVGPHLDVLRTLLEQCRCERLHSGRDLYADPGALAMLIDRDTEQARD